MKNIIYSILFLICIFSMIRWNVTEYNKSLIPVEGTITHLYKEDDGYYGAIVDWDDYGTSVINAGSFVYYTYSAGDRYSKLPSYLPIMGITGYAYLPNEYGNMFKSLFYAMLQILGILFVGSEIVRKLKRRYL